MTGLERLADSIKAELEQRLPGQRKTQRGKLSLLVATMLDARSANLMNLAAANPDPGPVEDLGSSSGSHAGGPVRRTGVTAGVAGRGGAIGFEIQKALLDAVAPLASVTLLGSTERPI